MLAPTVSLEDRQTGKCSTLRLRLRPYVGKVVSHSVEGAVKGMVSVMEFKGALGVEEYDGLLIIPSHGK